jgi:hypothetical protein
VPLLSSSDPLERILEEAWFVENRALRIHQRMKAGVTWEWLMYLRERRIELEARVKAIRRAGLELDDDA